jgi:hypothetical protein
VDFSSLANMKLSDFENIGQAKYNEGFKAALTVVTKILNKSICEDYLADGECEHTICPHNTEIIEGLENAKRNLG